ncbi:hypothetical protein E6W39_37070 [Kitasatospora acidiphila]|uniref:Uncharacterized protein n=1 Tax=Kitasatospora acidiphila TaxID=2567942 RepID=A0A540WCK0_9ACTN|nr:DUF6126 family protein [Kitasatospora acidiphila]TQF06781.1 hypothetical protein E6W39_37070 [Kitasatospora acidiphila]
MVEQSAPPFVSPTDAAARNAAESTVRDERTKRKAALVRAAIYIAGTHFFAFFVMLLFFLGDHKH